MKPVVLGLAVAATLAAGPVAAQNPDELLKKFGCTACHAIDKKLVGPAYKDVAKKYAGQKDAEANLIKKVKAGGSGVWGQVPMPPNPQVPDGDLKAMVGYVLTLK